MGNSTTIRQTKIYSNNTQINKEKIFVFYVIMIKNINKALNSMHV